MSVVRFFVTQRTAEGTRVPIVGGSVRATPTRLLIVTADPDEMVIPTPVFKPLASGRLDLPVDATGPSWCWRFTVFDDGRRVLHDGYYAVSDSVAPLDYPADLVRVDPTTLEPECTGSGDVLVIDGLTITDNLDGTLTIGA